MAHISFNGRELVDDRGNLHPLRSGWLVDAAKAPGQVTRKDGWDAQVRSARLQLYTLATIKRNRSQRARRLRRVIWLLLFVPSMLIVVTRMEGEVLMINLVALPLFGAGAYCMIKRAERGPDPRVFEALKELPFVCVACGYGLDGIDAQPDGCVMCPECTGCWRHPTPEHY